MSDSSLAKFRVTYLTEKLPRTVTLLYVEDFWKKSHSNICEGF